ncbi:hypothetical protein FRB97_000241 [Tulasnella sp. 331]|nr:hypothetical protein FRB97_000241 [Tulasnella sp. 331]
METLRATSQELGDKAADRAFKFRRQLCDTSPFHTLPAKLILEIIRLALNFPSRRNAEKFTSGYHDKLHILASVTYVFTLIIKQAPELWSVLDTNDDETNWQMSLRLSRFGPLVVQQEQAGRFGYLSWSAVLQINPRGKVVYMATHKASELETIEAPYLETLTLEADCGLAISDLFPGGTLRRRKLSITCITLRHWKSLVIHQLHSLSLPWIADHEGPFWKMLLEAL